MKNLLLLFILTALCSTFSMTVQAQNGIKISVQGTLKDANGAAVDNGQYDVIFRLYNTTTGNTSTALWEENATVQVLGGVYSHKLGTTNPLNASDFGSTLYVGVEIEGVELTPRTELTYAPYTLHTQYATASGNGTPAGAMMPFAGPLANVPADYLPCDGRALNSADYPDLFAALGTTWGDGSTGPGAVSGTTNFNVPDTRGQFLRGWDNGAGVDSGRTYASNQGDENKSHTHSMSSNGSHTHSHSDKQVSTSYVGYAGSNEYQMYRVNSEPDVSRTTGSNGNHSHTIYNSGGSESRPKNIAILYIIKI